MPSLRALVLVLTVVVAGALGAGPAQAARPVVLGPGEAPGVAVDAAGTAHIAYNADYVDDVGQPLMYCAWPRAAKTCTPRAIVSDRESPSAQPALVQAGPAPGEITVVSERVGIQAVKSADGGANFGPPATLGYGNYFRGAFGPGGTLALAYRNAFRSRSLAAFADGDASLGLNLDYQTNSDVGFSGTRPVFVSGAARPGIAVSSWNGTGDVHDPAMWSGPYKIAESNDFAVAGGPRGLWLAYADFGDGGRNRIVARKFSGRRFGRAYRVPVGRLDLPFVNGLGFAQDPTGRMVVVWNNGPSGRLEYAASRTGTRWSKPRVLASGVASAYEIQVALGADGRGVVVWDELGGDDVNAAKISVRPLLR